LIGFALASALGGASLNVPMLVTARSIQGAFGALLAPSVLALLTTTFIEPAERGKAFAIYGGIAGAASAYLVGKAASAANVKAAAVHSYTTAFSWSALVFLIGAVVAGLVLPRGNLAALANSGEPVPSPPPDG